MSTWKEAYVNLAVEIDATLSDPTHDMDHLRAGRFVMIDITTIGDGSDPGYGTEASVRLLREMDLLVREAKFIGYSPDRNNMVKSINDFTIFYFGDLDDFVNSLDWPDLCIPVFWTSLTEDTGTDTSNWIVCS